MNRVRFVLLFIIVNLFLDTTGYGRDFSYVSCLRPPLITSNNGKNICSEVIKAMHGNMSLKEFANKILALDLTFGLAGSLKLENLVMVKQLNPSYIGFRGGVCDENKRQLALSAEKIMAICNLNVSLL